MRMKKLLAAFLAAVMVLCVIPFTASASEAEIMMVDGERTVLVSAFGKMQYNGKATVTFKSINDAIAALGHEGGTILFKGTQKVGSFNDLEGRKDVTIKGIDTNVLGNILDFSNIAEINLKGNLNLDLLLLKASEGAYIFTNGFNLRTGSDFDTYKKLEYLSMGNNVMVYYNSPSMTVGNPTGNVGAFTISGGRYTYITPGAVNGHTVNADAFAKVTGEAKVINFVTGSVDGTSNGDLKSVLSDGIVDTLVLGSIGGTVNGNVFAEVSGGQITNAAIGVDKGATINGNIIVSIKGGEFKNSIAKIADGNVTGKKIVIINSDTNVNVDNGAADVVIKIDGGIVHPQLNGNTITGYLITDNFGIPAKTITFNGSSQSSATGIYDFSDTLNNIKVSGKNSADLNEHANYVKGYEDGTFGPQNNMTKAEAVTLLSRLIIDENEIKGKVTSEIKDIPEGAWYEPYVGLFENLGYLEFVTDDSGNYFEPQKNITRAEFTQLIYKIAYLGEVEPSKKLSTIPDVSTTSVYLPAVSFATSAGIVTGYPDGTFGPDNNITRAEVVTMVNRLLGRTPTGVAGVNNFSDISSHWANSQILAACNPEGVAWTASTSGKEYTLTGTSAKDYVIGLYEQGKSLSAEAIRRGIDTISEQMKKDILNSPNTAEIYADKMNGDVYYISEKNGNDDNDGKSPETAVKTIEGFYKKFRLPKAGTAVLFERGGIYRGQIKLDRNGIIYGSYGEGPKPLLLQSKKNYADESLWEKTKWPNVWKCKDSLHWVGVIAFDHDVYDYSENTYNELYGRMINAGIDDVKGVQDLKEDLQFYSVIAETDQSPENSGVNDDDLFLYSAKGNPGKRFASIEIGERYDIMDGDASNVIIDNLALKFSGAHGISSFTIKNRTVTNCVFSWIGGSVLETDFQGKGKPINYGNAVEVFGGCDGYFVENCWMYQIYDTGVTHQYSKEDACVQKNVRYTGNLIELCHWGIEYYNNNDNGKLAKNKKYTADVISRYNVVNKSGYGWGSISRNRTWEAFSYCSSSLCTNYDYYTEYNIFNLSGGYIIYLPPQATEEPDKNIYVQHIGHKLGNLKGMMRYCDEYAADHLKKDYGDKNPLMIIVDSDLEPAPSRTFPPITK